MKKINILLILGLVVLVMFSCNNGKDTTAPVITLKGSSDTTIALNSTWTDPELQLLMMKMEMYQ